MLAEVTYASLKSSITCMMLLPKVNFQTLFLLNTKKNGHLYIFFLNVFLGGTWNLAQLNIVYQATKEQSQRFEASPELADLPDTVDRFAENNGELTPEKDQSEPSRKRARTVQTDDIDAESLKALKQEQEDQTQLVDSFGP